MKKQERDVSAETAANTSTNTTTGQHLLHSRKLIIGRSLLSGLAGMVPVPALDDALVRGMRRGLLGSLAERRQVDIDQAALDVLCADGPTVQPTTVWTVLSSAIPVLRPRSWARRFLVGFLLLRRLDEVVRLFHLATLFDHYCARHHVGLAIDEAAARRLRPVFDETSKRTQREAVTEVFTAALSAIGATLVKLPGRLYHLLPGRGEASKEPDPGPPAKDAVSAAFIEPLVAETLLAKALPAVREQTQRLLQNETLTRYTGRLARAFDRRWARKVL